MSLVFSQYYKTKFNNKFNPAPEKKEPWQKNNFANENINEINPAMYSKPLHHDSERFTQ